MIIKNKQISTTTLYLPEFDRSFFIKNNHKNKKYLTEIILITNNISYNLIFWLIWHLYVIKIEHIKIVFNNITLNNKIIDFLKNKFTEKIEIAVIENNISQSEIYTQYVNNSDATWVLPIDDDEYLYLNNQNINDILNNTTSIKISFPWLYMFSEKMKTNTDLSIPYFLNYQYFNPNIEEHYFKTFINTNYIHLYKECSNVANLKKEIIALNNIQKNTEINIKQILGTVHNPITIVNDVFVPSFNVSDDKFYFGYCSYNKNLNFNNGCILHFKYRSLNEYIKKIENIKNNKKFTDLPIQYFESVTIDEFNKMYSNYQNFKHVDIGINMNRQLLNYNNIVEEFKNIIC